MKRYRIASLVVAVASIFSVGIAFAMQDRYTLKSPTGLSLLGNPAMIKAYADGFPANGKSVPDGAAFVKIEWAKARDTTAGDAMVVPGNLAEVAFMVKDSKRFPRTDGWGYATHDFVFTHYPKR
jgi:Cytochrome P460